LTTLLFGRLAPFTGLLGFVLVAYVLFLAAYAVLASFVDDAPSVRDKVMTVLMWTATVVALLALLDVVLFILWRGRTALIHANFFTQDMSRTGPLQPLTSGGITHALVGTIWMISIALAITVPLGMATAVYLNEVGGAMARTVRTLVDAMTALPSIVAGLFIYATLVITLHQKNGLFAAIAVSVVMLPIIIRSSDVVLRLVPGNLREASAALGAPQWRTVWHVVLPTARSGLATSVILGMARGLGETAPVLLTAGFTASLNSNPLHGPMVSLPLQAFEFALNSSPAYRARGFATAAFLMLVVLALFIIARGVGGRGPGHVSARRARRSVRRSARDLARFEAQSQHAMPHSQTGDAPDVQLA
jgi:phosphate transport system permease protein